MNVRLIGVLVLGAGLAGCTWRGTLGGLHDVPSTGRDLPFPVGVYVADGQPTPCERPPDGAVFDPSAVCTTCRFMAFADDGTFVVAESEEALRNPTAYHDPYGLAVRLGNYRVEGGRVIARAVGPGGDSGYSRIVSTFDLAPTGPASFAYDVAFTADGPTGCSRRGYVSAR